MSATSTDVTRISQILARHSGEILESWLSSLRNRPDYRISVTELESQCSTFLRRLSEACSGGGTISIRNAAYAPIVEMIGDISRSRAN